MCRCWHQFAESLAHPSVRTAAVAPLLLPTRDSSSSKPTHTRYARVCVRGRCVGFGRTPELLDALIERVELSCQSRGPKWPVPCTPNAPRPRPAKRTSGTRPARSRCWLHHAAARTRWPTAFYLIAGCVTLPATDDDDLNESVHLLWRWWRACGRRTWPTRSEAIPSERAPVVDRCRATTTPLTAIRARALTAMAAILMTATTSSHSCCRVRAVIMFIRCYDFSPHRLSITKRLRRW